MGDDLERKPSVLLWRGRPVEELTREELLVAVHNLASTIERNYEQLRQERELMKDFRRLGGR